MPVMNNTEDRTVRHTGRGMSASQADKATGTPMVHIGDMLDPTTGVSLTPKMILEVASETPSITPAEDGEEQ